MCGWRRWRFVRLLDLLGAEAEVEGGVLRRLLLEVGVRLLVVVQQDEGGARLEAGQVRGPDSGRPLQRQAVILNSVKAD